MFTEKMVVKTMVKLAEQMEQLVQNQEKIVDALVEIKESLKPESKKQSDGCVYDIDYQLDRIKSDRKNDRFCTADGGPFSHC